MRFLRARCVITHLVAHSETSTLSHTHTFAASTHSLFHTHTHPLLPHHHTHSPPVHSFSHHHIHPSTHFHIAAPIRTLSRRHTRALNGTSPHPSIHSLSRHHTHTLTNRARCASSDPHPLTMTSPHPYAHQPCQVCQFGPTPTDYDVTTPIRSPTAPGVPVRNSAIHNVYV
jgi:hypothetical protein